MKYVVANWKMYCGISEAQKLVLEIKNGLRQTDYKNVKLILCPPFTALETVRTTIGEHRTTIGIGAQNCHFMPSGAYTGEISSSQLKDFCEYVILGHSERRRYFNEDDELINKKIKAALSVGLKPIICVGEFKKGDSAQGIFKQVKKTIDGLKENDLNDIIFAYEPVWAIGTGKQPEPSYANKIIKEIKKITFFKTPALHGGSVDGDNVKNFVKEPDIDGFLVGGASLKATEFLKIIKEIGRG